MSVWRRKALELFPRYAAEIRDPRHSIYMLFFDLLPDVRKAHAEGDRAEAARIHGFAAWAFEQEELKNAAGVAFYEHLFDERWEDRHEIARRIPPRIAAAVMSLWEFRLPADRMAEVRKLFAAEKRRR